jgi:hypothetical protein
MRTLVHYCQSRKVRAVAFAGSSSATRSDVTQGVRPPGDVDNIYGIVAQDHPFPPAAITSLDKRCSSISER